MKTVVFLVPYDNPARAYQLARELSVERVALSAVAGVSCAAAQPVLNGMTDRLTRVRGILPSTFLCCEDPELSQLRGRISERPWVQEVLRHDHRSASLIAARMIWAIEAWERAHRRQTSVLVLNSFVLQLAMWSTTRGYILEDPSDMGPFKLEFYVSRREVTFPSNKVTYFPTP